MTQKFSIVFLLVLLAGCGRDSLDASAIEACDNASDFVARRLRVSVGSVIGPCNQESEQLKVERLSKEPQQYRVSNYVDTQSGFGPAMRQNFVAEVERVDGGWKLGELTIGDP